MYSHECCGKRHVTLADGTDDWKSIIDDFAKQVYDGSTDKINLSLYFKTANRLADVITKGIGSDFDYDSAANALQAQLKANLYQFSGAKSLTESLLFAEQMTDQDGKLKPFNKYREDIEKIHQNYNVRYLSAEYNNALASAQMAIKWKNFEELGTEWLEYRTAGDARVRESHEKLDGLILSINSPVWSRIFPPNNFGCRCNTVPADKPTAPVDENEAGKLGKEVVTNPVFENNVGKTGLVYKDSHPYFKAIDGKLKELDAIKNYGMQSVDKILLKTNLPASIHLDTKENYLEWWKAMVKKHGVGDSNFVLQDKLGTKILFDATPNGKNKFNYFRDHINEDEDRFEYAANLKDIIENPDEIWHFNYKGKIPTFCYVKYYDNMPLCITTTIESNSVKAETIYHINKSTSKKATRKGVLMYKK